MVAIVASMHANPHLKDKSYRRLQMVDVTVGPERRCRLLYRKARPSPSFVGDMFMPTGLAGDKAAIFKAIGSPLRVTILLRLEARRMTCSELAELIHCPRPTIHFHLQKMVAAGLLSRHSSDRMWNLLSADSACF
jgi:helix-turn-helix protein